MNLNELEDKEILAIYLNLRDNSNYDAMTDQEFKDSRERLGRVREEIFRRDLLQIKKASDL